VILKSKGIIARRKSYQLIRRLNDLPACTLEIDKLIKKSLRNSI